MVDAVVDALSSDVGNPLEAFSLLLQCFTTTMLLFFFLFFPWGFVYSRQSPSLEVWLHSLQFLVMWDWTCTHSLCFSRIRMNLKDSFWHNIWDEWKLSDQPTQLLLMRLEKDLSRALLKVGCQGSVESEVVTHMAV